MAADNDQIRVLLRSECGETVAEASHVRLEAVAHAGRVEEGGESLPIIPLQRSFELDVIDPAPCTAKAEAMLLLGWTVEEREDPLALTQAGELQDPASGGLRARRGIHAEHD